MPILYGAKAFMLWEELLSYKRKPYELWIFSLETLTQVCYSNPTYSETWRQILIENILFISKLFDNLLFPIFKIWFTFCSDVHNYQIKLNISSVICHFKHIAQPKLKVYFLKNALGNVNEEVKRGNFNYANQTYYNFLTIY